MAAKQRSPYYIARLNGGRTCGHRHRSSIAAIDCAADWRRALEDPIALTGPIHVIRVSANEVRRLPVAA